MTDRLVVVGGDAGGMTAAAQARRRRPDPGDLAIVAFERGEHTSYSACGIPYYVGDLVHHADDLVARTPSEHRRRGIEMHTRHEVTAIDVDRRSVRVLDLEAGGAERDVGFDGLVIATGAVPLRPDIDGIDATGVHGVQTLADGIALREMIDAERPRRAVVVGGGYIGLELAESLVQREIEVALVEKLAQPMSTLDEDMGALVADALQGVGVDLLLGVGVEAFDVSDGRVRAVVTDARTLPTDLVVLGLGVVPEVGLARAARVRIGETGGVATDAGMATSAEGVWAAGDCVETWHRVTRKPTRIALGTHANKQGRVAGINATGGAARFPGVIGTAVSKICAYEVARTGLGAREAADAGFDAVAATIESTTRAGYYPDAGPITVKLVAERGSGRVLGGQIVGREGAAKRIDIVATAVWNEMTAEEVLGLDLSYAPPFSPLWDPVLSAARKLVDGG